MNATRWLAAAGLFALLVLPVLAQKTPLPGEYVPGSVTPLPVNPPTLATINGSIAKKTGLTEAQVAAVIKELGPAMADKLAKGEGFEIPGAGNFRLIRIVAHRELVGNLAVFVPARNSIEFIPSGPVDQVLNRPGAVEGVPIGLPDFNPQLGNVTPGVRTPGTRTPGTRTPGLREAP